MSGMATGQVVKHMSDMGISVHRSTVKRIIKNHGRERQARLEGNQFCITRTTTVRTQNLINKVESKMSSMNPKPIKTIAKMLNVSRRTVGRIIYDDLRLKKRMKRKVHVLTGDNIKNRFKNSLLLSREIHGWKSEYAVSIDEAMFYYIPDMNGSDVVYLKEGMEMPQECVKPVKTVQSPRVMVVTGMTGRGPLKVRIVPKKTKVNANYYIKRVLKPIIEVELPKLYPEGLNHIFLHHDKATSHTSVKTMQFLKSMSEKYGIRFQKKEDIVVKGADCSPMDFFRVRVAKAQG